MNILIGALITLFTQVNDVVPYSNAVAFAPQDYEEITLYLDEIDNRLTPVIIIDHFYLDNGQYVYKDPAPIKKAITDSGHIGRLVFMFDEIGWKARQAGQTAGHALTLMAAIKQDFNGVEFAHIEAFAELYLQMTEDSGKLSMFFDADHIGFDCYGPFESCGGFGVPELPQITYLAEIYTQAQLAGSKAKIFLVPGAFQAVGFFDDNAAILGQLQAYNNLVTLYPDFVSGFGVFTCGTFEDKGQTLKGYCDIPEIRAEVENLLLNLKVNNE